MIPKSGKGMMLSGYVSSVGGFGLPLTDAQLAAVNAFRALPENNIYVCAKYGAPQELCKLAGIPVSPRLSIVAILDVSCARLIVVKYSRAPQSPRSHARRGCGGCSTARA